MPLVHDLEWQRARSRAERMLSREQRWQLARTKAERVLGRKYDPELPCEPEAPTGENNGDGVVSLPPAVRAIDEISIAKKVEPRSFDLLSPLLPLFERGEPAWLLATAVRTKVPSPSESDAELRARFQAASEDATEWPGLRSEYDKITGKVDFLAAPIKFQAQEGTTPAARGEKTTIANPERLYATQFWLHQDDQRGYGGGRAMLPEHEAKFGKAPVVAETIDGRLHLLDGHHTVFYHLRDGGRALDAFVFKVQTAIFEDGSK